MQVCMLDDAKLPDRRSCCEGVMRTTIKVGNLPNDLDIQAIRDVFAGHNVHILFIEVEPTIAFVHCSWTPELQDVVSSLSGYSLKCGRVLTLQLTEGDEDVRRREETRKKNQTPSCTLFVVGFDTTSISETDISFSFSEIARVQKVMIRKNFCFVRFRDVQSSTLVMENFHGKTVLGRVISIEYGMPGGSSSAMPHSALVSNAGTQQRQPNDNLNSEDKNYSQASQSSGKRSNEHRSEILEFRTLKSRKYSRSRSRDRTQRDQHSKTSLYDRDRDYFPSEFFPCNSKSMGSSHKFQIGTTGDTNVVHVRGQTVR